MMRGTKSSTPIILEDVGLVIWIVCLRFPTNMSLTSYLRELGFSLWGVTEKAETMKEQEGRTLVKQMRTIMCLTLGLIDTILFKKSQNNIKVSSL
jgi:hypothetical protein